MSFIAGEPFCLFFNALENSVKSDTHVSVHWVQQKFSSQTNSIREPKKQEARNKKKTFSKVFLNFLLQLMYSCLPGMGSLFSQKVVFQP